VFGTRELEIENAAGATVELTLKYLALSGAGEWVWAPSGEDGQPATWSYSVGDGVRGRLTGPLGSNIRARKVVVKAVSANGGTAWPERTFDLVPEGSYSADEAGAFGVRLAPGGVWGDLDGGGGSDGPGPGGGDVSAPKTSVFGPSGYKMWLGWPTASPPNSLVASDDTTLDLSSTTSGFERYVDFYVTGQPKTDGTARSLAVTLEAKSSKDGYVEAYLYDWQTKKWDYIGKQGVGYDDRTLVFTSPEPQAHASPEGKVHIRFLQRTKLWNTFTFQGDRVRFELVTE
jgi:hypothetical protein